MMISQEKTQAGCNQSDHRALWVAAWWLSVKPPPGPSVGGSWLPTPPERPLYPAFLHTLLGPKTGRRKWNTQRSRPSAAVQRLPIELGYKRASASRGPGAWPWPETTHPPAGSISSSCLPWPLVVSKVLSINQYPPSTAGETSAPLG